LHQTLFSAYRWLALFRSYNMAALMEAKDLENLVRPAEPLPIVAVLRDILPKGRKTWAEIQEEDEEMESAHPGKGKGKIKGKGKGNANNETQKGKGKGHAGKVEAMGKGKRNDGRHPFHIRIQVEEHMWEFRSVGSDIIGPGGEHMKEIISQCKNEVKMRLVGKGSGTKERPFSKGSGTKGKGSGKGSGTKGKGWGKGSGAKGTEETESTGPLTLAVTCHSEEDYHIASQMASELVRDAHAKYRQRCKDNNQPCPELFVEVIPGFREESRSR